MCKTDESGRSTREQILEAAGPIFADNGYQSATVREICRAAGVNVAAINYYFGDKQQLYVQTVSHAYRRRLDEVPVPQWPESTSPQEKLYLFVRALVGRMIGADRATWHVRLMVREVLQPTEACRALVEDYFRPQFELLLGIIAELMPAGASSMDHQRVAFSIVGQCVYYRVAGEIVELMVDDSVLAERFTIPALADHITRFSLRALGCDASVLDQLPVFPAVTGSETADMARETRQTNEE